jgi:hypothetical protein
MRYQAMASLDKNVSVVATRNSERAAEYEANRYRDFYAQIGIKVRVWTRPAPSKVKDKVRRVLRAMKTMYVAYDGIGRVISTDIPSFEMALELAGSEGTVTEVTR